MNYLDKTAMMRSRSSGHNKLISKFHRAATLMASTMTMTQKTRAVRSK